jgi:hypothetical protein
LDDGEQVIECWNLLAVLQSVSDDSQGEGANPVDGLIGTHTIDHDTSELRDDRDPPAVLFLFQVDLEFHGLFK